MIQGCANCRFWGRSNAGGHAACRAHPPRIIETVAQLDLASPHGGGEFDESTAFIATRFPQTADDEWCGEYEPTAQHSRMEFHP